MSRSIKVTTVVVTLCLAEVLGMAGYAAYPALLTGLARQWELSNTEAGWISGSYFLGYALAVPVLVSLTDRIDAKRVYVFSMSLAAAGALLFAAFAGGLWSALALQALMGVGLAGTYMPGLKLLADHISGPRQSRAIAFYTACFSIGGGVSFLMAGLAAELFGWRGAFYAATVSAAVATALVWAVIPATSAVRARSGEPEAGPPRRALLDFRPVFRNRAAIGYTIGYGGHCWELFGLRSWLVAFLAFAAGRDGVDGVTPSTIASVLVMSGVVSSVLGNELAVRIGRRRLVTMVMLSSAVIACLTGFAATGGFVLTVAACALYNLAVMGDSASLTAGAVANAHIDQRGATMAVHSLFGFGAAFFAPLVFGAVLDLGGGQDSVTAWGLGFVSLAAGGLVGFAGLALVHFARRRRESGVVAP